MSSFRAETRIHEFFMQCKLIRDLVLFTKKNVLSLKGELGFARANIERLNRAVTELANRNGRLEAELRRLRARSRHKKPSFSQQSTDQQPSCLSSQLVCLSPQPIDCLSPQSTDCLSPQSTICLSPQSTICLSPQSTTCLSPQPSRLSPQPSCLSPQSTTCLSPLACLSPQQDDQPASLWQLQARQPIAAGAAWGFERIELPYLHSVGYSSTAQLYDWCDAWAAQ